MKVSTRDPLPRGDVISGKSWPGVAPAGRMRDALWKLRVLWRVFLGDAFERWRKEVWRRDPDNYYCCNGNECGCYGASIREVYTAQSSESSDV